MINNQDLRLMETCEINLTHLMLVTPDADQRNKMQIQADAINHDRNVLIRKKVDEASADYRALTEQFNIANKAIKAAISDLRKVAETIQTVAKVVDVIAIVASSAT